MKDYKIVICGGGSTYTPGIVKNLLDVKDELAIRELPALISSWLRCASGVFRCVSRMSRSA